MTGDGCFLMSAIEMSTAARAGLPVKFFVLDDGGYHYMQMLQEPVYRRTTATEIARIDYAAFAQGVGIGYNQITDNADALAGHPASPGVPRPGPHSRRRQLRRARDPLAQRVAVAIHQKNAQWRSDSPGRPDRRASRSHPRTTMIDPRHRRRTAGESGGSGRLQGC